MTDITLLDEFSDRFSGRFFGTYTGVVQDIEDPDDGDRIRATCPLVTGDKDEQLDWAWPKPMFSGAKGNYGSSFLPQKGDLVWITFVDGDVQQPIWEHGPYGYNSGKNSMVKHARGVPDTEDIGHKGGDNIPSSQYKGERGKVRLIKTPVGHLIELDDTDGSERVQILHKNGTHIEMLPDGSIHIVSVGPSRIFVGGNKTEKISGTAKTVVEGEVHTQIQKDEKKRIEGDYENFTLGDSSYKVGKLTHYIRGDKNIECKGGLYAAFDGNSEEMVGGNRSLVITRSDYRHVLETANHVFSNATGTPLDTVFNLHTSNGVLVIKNTDVTGNASGSIMEMMNAQPSTHIYSGAAPSAAVPISGIGVSQGSGLFLEGSGAGTILYSMINLILRAMALVSIEAPVVNIGPKGGYQPALLGMIAATLFDSHVHTSGMPGSPTTPPLAPIMAATALSKSVYVGL